MGRNLWILLIHALGTDLADAYSVFTDITFLGGIR